MTRMARHTSWIARGRKSEEGNIMNAKYLKNAWMEPTKRADLISGSRYPVEQPALLLDLPQVRLVGVEELLQKNIDIASHIYKIALRIF